MKKLTPQEFGSKGGTTTKLRHGTPHYQKSGRMGGKETLKRHGKEYFARIGRLGGKKKKTTKKAE